MVNENIKHCTSYVALMIIHQKNLCFPNGLVIVRQHIRPILTVTHTYRSSIFLEIVLGCVNHPPYENKNSTCFEVELHVKGYEW